MQTQEDMEVIPSIREKLSHSEPSSPTSVLQPEVSSGLKQIALTKIISLQYCFKCFSYLSVPPVLVNFRRQSICGRCKQPDFIRESRLQTAYSLYNIISPYCVFKCVNHFEGCNELLTFDATAIHEEMCNFKYETYCSECVFCSFSGKWSQIINHSKKHHQESVIYDSIFDILVSKGAYKQKLIYVKESSLFLITIDITPEKFFLNISCLARNDNVQEFKIYLYLPHCDSDKILVGDGALNGMLKGYFELNIHEFKPYCKFNSDIIKCQILFEDNNLIENDSRIEKFRNKVIQKELTINKLRRDIEIVTANAHDSKKCLDMLINLTKKLSLTIFLCTKCRQCIKEVLCLCSSNHSCCLECSKDPCNLCTFPRLWLKIANLDDISIECDWPQCPRHVKITDYYNHKVSCAFRPYKCPLTNCNIVSCPKEQFIDHWHCHEFLLFLDDFVLFQGYKTCEFYWLLSQELYNVILSYNAENIDLLIQEVNVLRSSVLICLGYCESCKKWNVLPLTNFCSVIRIRTANNHACRSGYHYKFSSIKLMKEP